MSGFKLDRETSWHSEINAFSIVLLKKTNKIFAIFLWLTQKTDLGETKWKIYLNGDNIDTVDFGCWEYEKKGNLLGKHIRWSLP